jgi:hypothetical protein
MPGRRGGRSARLIVAFATFEISAVVRRVALQAPRPVGCRIAHAWGQTPLRAYKQIGISMQHGSNMVGAELSHYPASGPTIPTVMNGAISAGFVGVHRNRRPPLPHGQWGAWFDAEFTQITSAQPTALWRGGDVQQRYPCRSWSLLQRLALSAPHPSMPSTYSSARAPHTKPAASSSTSGASCSGASAVTAGACCRRSSSS